MNVNIPTSGAEIGGAFGGEKATGGGRESGIFYLNIFKMYFSITIKENELSTHIYIILRIVG